MPFCSTSCDEGFNLPLLEANACGLIAVIFDIGSHSEVIIWGFLVNPKYPKMFWKAMEYACKIEAMEVFGKMSGIKFILPKIKGLTYIDKRFYDFKTNKMNKKVRK